MDPFTSGFLSDLLASLTANVFQALAGPIRKNVLGTEKEQALGRCIQNGLMSLMLDAGSHIKDNELKQHLADIFKKFFSMEDVAREIALLLRGQPLDKATMAYYFEEAGYDILRKVIILNFQLIIAGSIL
ncbi:MAG TPA: hypothetical protein VJL89_09220 [Thermodesulfovibrionia bacterium]|nr:hypothetical protein [Thermodesulfovibrionia bacterium]